MSTPDERTSVETVMLAAWLNVKPDLIPAYNVAHSNPSCMSAWKRVADAAQADLRADLAVAVEALRPFASYSGSSEFLKSADDDDLCAAASFTAGAYRNAAAIFARLGRDAGRE